MTLLAAAACAWLTLCLLYWQGSWQLMYHPEAANTRTPASAGLAYETVRFAATETGQTRLTGWWVPADGAKFTMLYLHGADGNLSKTVDALAALHHVGLNAFAMDYRGYGQSAPGRPSEPAMLEDARQGVEYLVQSRHLSADSVVIYGEGIGATLAAEVAGRDDGKLAGVVLADPVDDPMRTVFLDGRSRLVPARWLVRDRYDLAGASSRLLVPSLWLVQQRNGAAAEPPAAYRMVGAPKMSVVLQAPMTADPNYALEMKRWLDELGGGNRKP